MDSYTVYETDVDRFEGIAGLAYNFEKYSVHAGYRYIDWDHNGEAVHELNLGACFCWC